MGGREGWARREKEVASELCDIRVVAFIVEPRTYHGAGVAQM